MFFTFTSCDDFLTMTPRDKKIVKTVEDYRDIMASFMKFVSTPNPPQEKLFGIDEYAFPQFDVSNPLAIYTGESLMSKTKLYFNPDNNEYTGYGRNYLLWLNSASGVWNGYYKFLGPINMIISDIEKVEAKNLDTRNYVKGEALVWRAFAYFKLLQYYAPYKKNEYGIPMYLTPSEDIGTTMPERKTQKAVYQQILSDCQKALDLMKETASNDWNYAWKADFIHAMLASIYNYKALSAAAEPDDWKNAEKHADIARTGRRLTSNAETLKRIFDCSKKRASSILTNDEFFIRIVGGSNRSSMFRYNRSYYSWLATGSVNSSYLAIFKDTDKRKSFYFTNKNTLNNKYNMLADGSFADGGCLMPFRLAEVYLIKAEAACRQGNVSAAMKILQEFKAARYTDAQVLPTSKDALLKEIHLEKKREFYQENDMIWMEMKRLGETLERTVNGETATLKSDDFRYSFPIPTEEMKRNKNMKQNPGWEAVVF